MENKKFIDSEVELVEDITLRNYQYASKALEAKGWLLKDHRSYNKKSWKYPKVEFPYKCFLFCKEDRGIFVEVTNDNDGVEHCVAASSLAANEKLDLKKINAIFDHYKGEDKE